MKLISEINIDWVKPYFTNMVKVIILYYYRLIYLNWLELNFNREVVMLFKKEDWKNNKKLKNKKRMNRSRKKKNIHNIRLDMSKEKKSKYEYVVI